MELIQCRLSRDFASRLVNRVSSMRLFIIHLENIVLEFAKLYVPIVFVIKVLSSNKRKCLQSNNLL